MITQIIKIFRLLGLSRALRMKKHHAQGLTYIRGYAATSCWWTLLKNGFLDELNTHNHINIPDYLNTNSCDANVLHFILEYLTGIGLLAQNNQNITLTPTGRTLLAEPRGMFELLAAYEPCFTNLPDLLTGAKRYGTDICRDVTYVGIGSGRLCEQLPYPIMRQMVRDHKCTSVLDLGCGDLALLSGLCAADPNIRCHGIDFSEQMTTFNLKALSKNSYDHRLTAAQADMFDLPNMPTDCPPVDCIAACDTFHEYLDQPDRISNLLRDLRTRFDSPMFVIGEFCLQDPAWLAKHPTASLEHHLFHQLSNQQIGTAAQWRDIFHNAGLQIIDEQVFDLIGHGYFTLR